MRLVNVPPGGQTVTLGNVSCVMGRTEIEVEMGLSSHPRNRLLHFRSEIQSHVATPALLYHEDIAQLSLCLYGIREPIIDYFCATAEKVSTNQRPVS